MPESNKDPSDRERPTPLPYRGPEGPRIPRTGAQVVLGALAFFAWVGVVIGICVTMSRVPLFNQNAGWIISAISVSFVVLVFCAIRQSTRGWRAFIPGMLIGLGLAILIFAGICAVALRNI